MQKKLPNKKSKPDEIEELNTFIESKKIQNDALHKILQKFSVPIKNDTIKK